MSEHLDGFQTYCLFIALKNHFSSPTYDYFKYKGVTRATRETFESRVDRTQFTRLGRAIKPDHIEHYLVANFLRGRAWVGDFLTTEAEKTFLAYAKRQANLMAFVISELEEVLSELPNSKALFTAEEGEYPPILLKTMDGTFCHDSLIVLNSLVRFSDVYDEKYGLDDIVWGKIRFTCQRLKGFINFDKQVAKRELKPILL